MNTSTCKRARSSVSLSETIVGMADDSVSSSKMRRISMDDLFASLERIDKPALLARKWIESYRKDAVESMAQLLTLIVNFAGCKSTVRKEDLTEDFDTTSNQSTIKIIDSLCAQYCKQSSFESYPLSCVRSMKWRKVCHNYVKFIVILIEQCQQGIIYDDYFLAKLNNFVIALSDTQIRAFRHTATVTAIKIMTAISYVVITLQSTLGNGRAQEESQRKSVRKSANMMLSFTGQLELYESRLKDLLDLLKNMFQSVFVRRVRDKVGEIRTQCVAELGEWITLLPEIFLQDSKLKYIGWSFYDKSDSVRNAAISALIPLYDSNVECIAQLELFMSRFKDRIVEMVHDVDIEVTTKAIQLIRLIYLRTPEMLSDRDCERMYELVYSQHLSIARNAGNFLNDRLFRVNSKYRERGEVLLTARGKKRSPNTPLIRDLIQFFIESELHDHATYLVDSLIGTNDMLKDWECMTDLLLEEPGLFEEPLDNRQESALIDIMSSAVQQIATGEHPVGRSVKGVKNKPKTVADTKLLENEQNKITDHFIHTLPRLVLKYKADDLKLIGLLEIPLHFRLKNYTQFVDELEDLLKLINEAVDIHTNDELLLKCAKIYEHLYDEHFAFHRSVWSAKIFLLDSLFHRKYIPLVNSYDTSNSSTIPSDLTMTLKKLAVFASCHDMSSYDLWTNVFQRWIVPAKNDHHHHRHDIYSIPSEILIQSISVTFHNFLWDLHDASKSMSTSSGRIFRSHSRLSPIKTRLTQFIKCLSKLLSHEREEVNIEAYSCLCDLLIIFGKGLTKTVTDPDSGSLAELVYKPSMELATRLESFVIDKVYTYPEDDPMDEISIGNIEPIQQLHTKRHILAGFCKLIVCSVIPMRFAYHPIKHYTQFFNDYGDIVKTLLNRMRKMNPEIYTKTMERVVQDCSAANSKVKPIRSDISDFFHLSNLD